MGNCAGKAGQGLEEGPAAAELSPAGAAQPRPRSKSSGLLPISALRADTPGVNHVIHFNNAGCSLPPLPVLRAVEGYLHLEATIGGYEAFDREHEALARPYNAIAALLNCEPSEIAVVTSATAAWQQVVYGLAWCWKPGDRLLTSMAEYGSNYLAYLQLRKRTGVEIQVIPEKINGEIDLEALEKLVLAGPSKPVLISITHIPTSSGRVYDAAGVGAVAAKHGVLYMLDACQTVGQVPVDVQTIKCNFLAATGRKFLRAPRGSGFLYVSRQVMDQFEPATIDNVGATWTAADQYQLQPTAKRFEQYEMSFAAKVGLGMAVEYCVALGPEFIHQRIQHLAHILRAGLGMLEGVTVHDRGRQLCGIVSFTKEGWTVEGIHERLAERSINVSVSRVGSSRLDFEARGLKAVVRASVHYYNTEKEIQALLDALKGLPSAQPEV